MSSATDEGEGGKVTAECDYPSTDSSHVCSADGAQVAINVCEAAMCLGLPVDSLFSEEWCLVDMMASATDQEEGGKVTAECDCPIVDSSPVCFADGAQVAINACEAAMCLGLPVDSFSEEWCLVDMMASATDQEEGGKVTAECDCPIVESSPVCFADGAQVAINACEAAMCLGLPVDSFSEEWCIMADMEERKDELDELMKGKEERSLRSATTPVQTRLMCALQTAPRWPSTSAMLPCALDSRSTASPRNGAWLTWKKGKMN